MKKTLLVIASVLFIVAAGARTIGDVNGDGKVNVGDIMAVINVMANQTTGIDTSVADVNGDGNVNVGDIMAVINIMAKQPDEVLASGNAEEVVARLQDLSGTDQADAAAVAEALKSNPNVEEAYCEDGNNVIIKMKDDECYSACPLYSLESLFSEDGEAEILIDMANESRRMNAVKNSGDRDKVAIFNFFEGGPYNTKFAYMNFIAAVFKNNGYVVENYGQGYDNNGIPTFTMNRLDDVISRSSQYAAIIIMSHGYETNDGNTFFATCERYNKDKTYKDKQTVLIDNNRFVAHSSKMNLDPQCLLYLGPCYGIPAQGYGQSPNTSVIGWQGKNAISQIHAGVFFHKLLYSDAWVGVRNALNSSIKEDPFNPQTKQYVSDNVGNWGYFFNPNVQPSYVDGMALVLEDFDNKTQRRDTWKDTGVIPCDKFIKKTGKDAEFIINGYIRGDVYGKWVKIQLEPIFRIQNKGEYSFTQPNARSGYIHDFKGSDYDSYFEYVILTLDGDAPEGIYRINVKTYDSNGWKLIEQPTPMYIIYSSKLSDNYARPELNQEDVTIPRILDADGQPVEEITLPAGTSKTFRVEAYNGHSLSTPCLDESVCTVSLDGTTLTVTGVAEGSTYIGVYDEQNKQIGVAEVTVTAGTPSLGNIVFADQTVKSICVSNWDTNGNGEISYDEAAAVEKLGRVFGNSIITSFDELQYFTGLESIGDYEFSGCSSLSSITIPNSVTNIGRNAFTKCSGLTSFVIPNSVTDIGMWAFSSCSSLTSINIPSSVISMGEHVFSGCSGLISVTIPNSLTSINSCVFWGCNGLTSITIPNSVTNIEQSAFQGCSGLTSITIPESVTYIGAQAFYGCSSLTSVSIPESVTYIGKIAFYATPWYNDWEETQAEGLLYRDQILWGYKGNQPEGNIEIEEGTKIIAGGTFYDCTGLTSVSIPNSVKSIGDDAFAYCRGLMYVFIPTSVTIIGDYAFWHCTSLTAVDFPNSVTSIGKEAFSDCTSLTSITIPNSVRSIGEDAFGLCTGLTTVTIHCAEIGPFLCGNASIREVILGDEVTSIGYSAFSNCTGLTSITIPNSVTSIESGAFYGCSGLTTVTIHCAEFGSCFRGNTSIREVILGDEVTSIDQYAFSDCSGLTTVTMGNSVTTIDLYAFYKCTSLTSIDIPNSMKNIGYNAFMGCTNLTSITINSSMMEIDQSAISGCNALSTVIFHCPVIMPWFSGINSIQEVVIGEEVTTIGSGAFYDCSGLTSIDIPNTVTTIESVAFHGCTSLTSVEIPNSVTTIEYGAFDDCTSLASVTFHCAEIKDGFSQNTSIQEIIFGDEVEKIGYSAFSGCTGLTSITIPNSVTSIGNSAFYYCSGLTSVTIPSSVTSIESYAFSDCTNLTSIVIDATVPPSIDYTTFENTNDCPIYVPSESLEYYKSWEEWYSYYGRIKAKP